MSRNLEISIVMRCTSDLRFVDEALRSAAGQQKIPAGTLELIVVADGLDAEASTKLRSMVDALEGPPTRVLEAGSENGANAWALGVAESNGRIVALLEGHDRFHPERLFRMLQAAPAIVGGDWIACSAMAFIDALGDPGRADSPAAMAYRRALLDASQFPSVGFALLRQNPAQTLGNLVFTRSLHQAVGGFDAHDDDPAWAFLLAALERVEPIILPDPLLERRDSGRASCLPDLSLDPEHAADLRRQRLDAWLALIKGNRVPANLLAPCATHWPVYFELFVSRARVDRRIGDEERSGDPRDETPWAPPTASEPSGWQSWGDWVEIDDASARDFVTDARVSAAERSALAIAQTVFRTSHNHPDDEAALFHGLEQAYECRVHPSGRLRASKAWPFEEAPDDRDEARSNSLVAAAPRPSPRRGLRALPPLRWYSQLRQHLRFRRLIRDSGLFDVAGYRVQGRERGLRVVDPISHFLRGAESHGLDPHPLFHTRYYLERNPDLRGQVNPLLHYLLAGDSEGRRPHWLFDPAWYRMKYGDVDDADENALAHFVHRGVPEGRRGHPRHDLVRALHAAARRGGRAQWMRFVDEAQSGAAGARHRIEMREAIEHSDRAAGRGDTPGDRQRLRRQADRLRRSPLFDAEFHRTWFGSDTERQGDAARRFLEHAAVEGVGFIGLDRMHDELERLALQFDDETRPELGLLRRAAERATEAATPPSSARLDSRVNSHLNSHPNAHLNAHVSLFVSSKGNLFFSEMAELLAHGFRRAGAEATIHDERETPPTTQLAPGEHRIIIAPHEFFLLGDGPKRLSRGFLETASLWLAEQPGSEFFAMGIWFAQFARRVLDVNPLSALGWGALGFDARALPLGHVDGFEAYADAREIEAPHIRQALRPRARPACRAEAPLAQRPIDVSFNGVLTDRRERFFARHAHVFEGLECALFMPSPATPVSVRLASSLTPGDATALSQRSKILLNVHRGETGYFEWHRLVVRGLWQRALVVSETSMPVPGLEPGEHYVEADLDELPARIEWLIRSEAGRAEAERICTAGYQALREKYPLAALCAAFLDDDDGFEPSDPEGSLR